MSLTVWLTGLPCAGKTTIARAVCRKADAVLLDGDEIRGTPLSDDVGFSPADRRKHLLRVATVAGVLNDAGRSVVAAFVSPTIAVRNAVAGQVGRDRFRLVYVDTPAMECRARDVKGMWARAEAGEIADFTGLGAPYEVPAEPDLTVSTDGTIDEAAGRIVDAFFRPPPPASMFIGRFQPLYDGHERLIRHVLAEGCDVVVGLRETLVGPDNPYGIAERKGMFREAFPTEWANGSLRVISLPDISEVCYGRSVGWGIREIRLDADTEAISATRIREQQCALDSSATE